MGKVRSYLPEKTNVLTCTATATMEIFNEITKVLSMKNPHIVAVPPERHNIMYSVIPKKDLDDVADIGA